MVVVLLTSADFVSAVVVVVVNVFAASCFAVNVTWLVVGMVTIRRGIQPSSFMLLEVK